MRPPPPHPSTEYHRVRTFVAIRLPVLRAVHPCGTTVPNSTESGHSWLSGSRYFVQTTPAATQCPTPSNRDIRGYPASRCSVKHRTLSPIAQYHRIMKFTDIRLPVLRTIYSGPLVQSIAFSQIAKSHRIMTSFVIRLSVLRTVYHSHTHSSTPQSLNRVKIIVVIRIPVIRTVYTLAPFSGKPIPSDGVQTES